MKAFLIALGIGAATLAATAPADAQPRHDGPRAEQRDHGRDYRRHDDRRHRAARHHRQRYSYYRNGHRYYGWR